MTPLAIAIRIIVIIIASLILSFGAWAYIDKILKAKHDEMMKNYVHSCNMGRTDAEIKEIQREDE